MPDAPNERRERLDPNILVTSSKRELSIIPPECKLMDASGPGWCRTAPAQRTMILSVKICPPTCPAHDDK
jgi:hypothetical protein